MSRIGSFRLSSASETGLPDAGSAVVTARDLQGALDDPINVAAGTLALRITTHLCRRMAVQGIGAYGRRREGLEAITAYPHIDYVTFAVDSRPERKRARWSSFSDERYLVLSAGGKRGRN